MTADEHDAGLPVSVSANAAPEISPRRTSRRYFLFALGFAVYIIAVWLIGWREVGDALAGADWGLILGAAALTGSGALVRMWKWRLALGANRNALGLYFLSRSAGVWSPARVGEFLPLLWRRHRNAQVAGWILFDRIIEILVTLVLGFIGLGVIQLIPARDLVLASIATMALAGMGIYVLTRSELLRGLTRRLTNASRLKVVLDALADSSAEFRRYLSAPVGLVGLTLVAKTVDLYAIVLIFWSLQTSVTVFLVAAAKCALAIVSYLPITPVTTGIPHTVQGWIMFESAGVEPATVAASVGIETVIMAAVFTVTALAASKAIRAAAL